MLVLLLEFIIVLTFVAGVFSVIHSDGRLILVAYLRVLIVGESLVGMID